MRFLLSLLCGFILGATVNSAVAQDAMTKQRYAVYSAALELMRFPKPDAFILVNDTTLNWHCGEASGNTVRMDDCGIWIHAQTPASIETELKKDWPPFDRTSWPNFIAATDKSVILKNNFKASWKYELVNIEKAKAKNPVDGVVLLSNVGFNDRGDEALVYILFLSYMQDVPTSGNLFLMRKSSHDTWEPAGREALMQMTK